MPTEPESVEGQEAAGRVDPVVMRLSAFQWLLLDDLAPGVWYDVYHNQGTGGAILPEWFYRNQSQPMATLKPMACAGAVQLRRVSDLKLPQVCRVA